MATVYYFDGQYTRSVFKNGVEHRAKNGSKFSAPQSEEGRQGIKIFIQRGGGMWSSASQWKWLREGTPNATLPEVLQMVRSGAFFITIIKFFDESLVMMRHFMVCKRRLVLSDLAL